MLYENTDIIRIFNENLSKAKNSLKNLDFASNLEVEFRGLTGWVCEQTIANCIIEELDKLGIENNLIEQFPLNKLNTEKKNFRAKADLRVDIKNITFFVEIKSKGVFGENAGDKYIHYKEIIEMNNCFYLYLTLDETKASYKNRFIEIFGD